MKPRVRFVYAPQLAAWRLGEDHPFKPERLDALKDLLERTGLLPDELVRAPDALPAGSLEAVHDPGYVEVVRAASHGKRLEEAYRHGLGTSDTPLSPGLHDAVTSVCAATWTAMNVVLSGEATRAAAFSGGLHHAMRDRASGFCVYNDLNVAIAHARSKGARVAYLDVDAHHGDGVQDAFYADADVLTVSLHESGRYLFPGTGYGSELGREAGRGWSVNVPLEPFTDDASFLEAFDLVVPAALEAFAPDVIVLQAGADAHALDPLADLQLSLQGMRAVYERVVGLADALCEGRLVVTGGGGYAAFHVPPRAWAHAWSAMTGAPLPERLPEAWRQRWRDVAGHDLPEFALDAPQDTLPESRRVAMTSHNRAVARRVLDVASPLWARRVGEEST